MKDVKSLFLCAALLACGVSVTSCGGEDDPQANLVDAITPSSFSYVVDSDGIGRVFSGPTYRVTFDDDHKTAVVRMENVRWSDNMSASNYSYSDVAWKFNPDNKARVIDAARALPDAAGAPEITDMEITMYEPVEMDGGLQMNGLSVSYTAAGEYEVTNIPYRTIFIGASETVNEADNTSFVTTEMNYVIDINPDKMTAVMKVENASFAESMPVMDMEFAGLKVTPEKGGFSLSAEQLVPTIGGTPYPRFNVTNLEMKVDLQGQSELVFNCMENYKVTAYFEAVYSGGN